MRERSPSTRARWTALATAIIIILASAESLPAQERVLDRFPVVLQAGLSTPAALSDAVGESLGDLPFDPQRGYGYVGGKAVMRSRCAAFGGDPDWPVAWRENPRKYSFRLPNGSYWLGLTFIETQVTEGALRSFGLLAEGNEIVGEIDIAAEVGDFHWLSIDARVELRDGWLDLEFLRREDRLPPRVSRIRVVPAGAIDFAAAVVPRLRVEPAFRSVRLAWEYPADRPVAGFGVFRSASADGPFESLSDYPVLTRGFVDREVEPGLTRYYRVRAYGLEGDQGPLSAVAAGTARDRFPGELKVFELRVPAGELGALRTRSEPSRSTPVEAELGSFGAAYRIDLRCETELDDWQFKKHYHLDLRGGKKFFGRRSLRFLADMGDPTFLRESLFARVHELLGLAAPRVEAIELLVNGSSVGLYLEKEVLDSRFRKRARLDTVGDFARVDGGERWQRDWRPVGEPVDREGSLWNATKFLHELHRLDEGEFEAFFERSFYVDRVLDRLAAAAICGRSPRSELSRIWLGDSRNGRWEYFVDRAPEGVFGIVSFERPRGAVVEESAAARSLGGPGLRLREMPFARWSILESRLFNRPSIWKRFLERVETLFRGKLSAGAIAENARAIHARIAPALAGDAHAWPPDGGESFRRGVQSVVEHHAAHGALLLEEIAAERAREPGALVINELGPSGDGDEGAWVEIFNRSGHPVSLSGYCLASDPARPSEWSFPDETIGPREYRVVTLRWGEGPFRSNLTVSPHGGRLFLSRAVTRGRYELGDAVFFGHRTAGFSYGRLADASWGHLAQPSPGAANEGEAVEPPPWRYRWGVERERNGDLTVWLRPDVRVAELTLRLQPPGRADYVSIPTRWDDKLFRYRVTLERFEGDPEAPFYFLAKSEGGVERPYPLTGEELPFRMPSRPPIFVNEVLPRPSENSPHGEFVEIYNAGDLPVNIEGMFLTDAQQNRRKWRIPLTEPIPPKGFAVLYADGLGRGLHAPFKLGNSGEYLGLYHRLENGNVLVDHIAYNAVPMDQSWGRRRDGEKGGRFWRDPTPGAKNLPKIPPEYLRKKDEK